MSNKSKIEWTDVTWNPVTGCSKVSDGCKNCYAERMTARFRKDHKPWTLANAQHNIKLHSDRLSIPLTWKKPRKVFVNSMSDLFHDLVPVDYILRVFLTMRNTPWHTYQVLTKRAERMKWFMNDFLPAAEALADATLQVKPPPSNVWLGVSVENQQAADERIPLLLQTPAAVRFLSCEPLLGPVDIAWSLSRNPLDIGSGILSRGHFSPGLETLKPLQWIICGGESGPEARPMHPDWARSLRDQCVDAGVPFFFKQWGEWWPSIDDGSAYGKGLLRKFPIFDWGNGIISRRCGVQLAGRWLDDCFWDEYPRAVQA